MKHPSVQRIFAASLVAVILSLMQQMLLPMAAGICLTPIFIAVLYAWAGWIPALLLSGGAIGALGVLGATFAENASYAVYAALAGGVVFVLPGLIAVWALNRRMPFFRRMVTAVLVQIGALAAVICVIYLGLRVDLVDFLTAYLRSAIGAMPISMLQPILQNFYLQGMLTEESVKLVTSGIVTAADYGKAFDQALETMNYQVRLALPGMLLVSGLLTGILMTSWPSLICARRGDEPPVQYYPISEWFLPSRVVVGLAVCMLTGFALQMAAVSGAAAVSITISAVGRTLFCVQGMASLSRRFKERGMRRGGRIAMIVASLLLATTLVTVVGAASALFGQKGAFSGWMRKKMEEKRKDDDDE